RTVSQYLCVARILHVELRFPGKPAGNPNGKRLTVVRLRRDLWIGEDGTGQPAIGAAQVDIEERQDFAPVFKGTQEVVGGWKLAEHGTRKDQAVKVVAFTGNRTTA